MYGLLRLCCAIAELRHGFWKWMVAFAKRREAVAFGSWTSVLVRMSRLVGFGDGR